MLILGFRNPRLTNKSGKDHFKALNLKNGFIGDDKSLIYELILALVSLWLLVNSIKTGKSQRKTSDWLFSIILLKRYFVYYYIIILPLFGFKRGYDMTERPDFILTEIQRCYNSNARWKFILFLIRRENDLNKMTKACQKGVRKVKEMKIKACETSKDH